MSLLARLLPSEEWPRLEALGPAWPAMDPETNNVRVIVVEQDGQIVATVVALRVVHVHGLWIAPSHRRSRGVWTRLWMGLRRVAQDWRVPAVLTEALPPGMDEIVKKLGGVDGHGPTVIIPLSTEGALCRS